MKTNLKTRTKVSEHSLITKAGISLSSIDLGGRAGFTFLQTYELELDGNTDKSVVLIQERKILNDDNNISISENVLKTGTE